VKSPGEDAISFADYHPASKLPGPTGKAIEIFDPVNETNNVAAIYDDSHRQQIVSAAQDARKQSRKRASRPRAEERLSAGRKSWGHLSGGKL